MKLYRGKIPVIAQQVVQRLIDANHIEVEPEIKEEAEQDLQAIMHNYLREERRLQDIVRDYIAEYQIEV